MGCSLRSQLARGIYISVCPFIQNLTSQLHPDSLIPDQLWEYIHTSLSLCRLEARKSPGPASCRVSECYHQTHNLPHSWTRPEVWGNKTKMAQLGQPALLDCCAEVHVWCVSIDDYLLHLMAGAPMRTSRCCGPEYLDKFCGTGSSSQLPIYPKFAIFLWICPVRSAIQTM